MHGLDSRIKNRDSSNKNYGYLTDTLSKLLLKIACMHHEKQVIANRSIKNTTGTPTPSYPTFFTIIPKGTSKINMVSMFEDIKTYQILTRTK